ncbi:hypothetical protein [Ruminococcus sp. Marseille-P6503]|uniref:hypothetical protein n=1 Tax=Ruminococcus sp. Marseille-P6503 TaxID=2364796 RepID=UPI000F5252AF|nr:hypothetical protein [Ruminococcus sp. Marseille-P6503]
MKFRDRIARFMYGRYGTDNLFYFLSVVYITLMLVNVFAHSWTLYVLGIAVFVITFYRVLSRNTVKRMNENVKFNRLFGGIKDWFLNRKSRIKQNKSYCFKRCPNCGKVLRLPRVKGKHSTRCPACSADFNVRVWFDRKK